MTFSRASLLLLLVAPSFAGASSSSSKDDSLSSSGTSKDYISASVTFEEPQPLTNEESAAMMFDADIGFVQEFNDWMKEHSKVYDTIQEKFHRMAIWLSNHELIEAHNKQEPKPSYTLGHNEFSDMTHDEFQEYFRLGEYSPGVPDFNPEEKNTPDFEEAMLRGASVERRRRLQISSSDEDVDKKNHPKEKDWRKEGAVMSVKNQGKCGSCWAFSAVEAIEGSMIVHGFPPRNLSVEELVDCDKSDLGCSGGLMDSAFIAEEGWDGLCSWEDYTYDAPDHPHDLTCKRSNCTAVEGSAVKSFIDLSPSKNEPCTEDDLEKALNKQPVSVAIQANQLAFMFYKGGVLDSNCGSSLDHGVLAVGYGEDKSTKEKYWIVKNSWGEKWGEDGYIRIARQSDVFDAPDAGQCGILMLPSYPEVEEKK